MTTIAEQLRAAALGPTPVQRFAPGFCVSDWIGDPDTHRVVMEFLRAAVDDDHISDWQRFVHAQEQECRVYLLFVACAVESETE